jgi:hypothetical protein
VTGGRTDPSVLATIAVKQSFTSILNTAATSGNVRPPFPYLPPLFSLTLFLSWRRGDER